MDIFLNIVIVAILLGIAGGIGLYLYKAKKRGQKCIGCPYSKQCGGGCCSSKQKDADE